MKMMPSLRVLGIDPGSRFMGFAVIEKKGNQLLPLTYGTTKVDLKQETHMRLTTIFDSVQALIDKYNPDHIAIEKVFFAKDAVAALKLGQARGVALLAVGKNQKKLFEYSPNEIKKAVVGHGHADKEQIAKMVNLILKISDFSTTDTSDALAIAICHLNSYAYRQTVQRQLLTTDL